MKQPMTQVEVSVDDLIQAIVRKLESKKAVLAQSITHGEITWRVSGNGKLDIKLRPNL